MSMMHARYNNYFTQSARILPFVMADKRPFSTYKGVHLHSHSGDLDGVEMFERFLKIRSILENFRILPKSSPSMMLFYRLSIISYKHRAGDDDDWWTHDFFWLIILTIIYWCAQQAELNTCLAIRYLLIKTHKDWSWTNWYLRRIVARTLFCQRVWKHMK